MPALIQVCRCPKCETIVKLTRGEVRKMWTRVLLEWPDVVPTIPKGEPIDLVPIPKKEEDVVRMRYRSE